MKKKPFKMWVFTLYPEVFPGPLGISLLGKALGDLWTLNVVDIRQFAQDKHQTVDDMAFGGGPGMVMRADVLDRALAETFSEKRPEILIYLSPRGKPLNQVKIKALSVCEEVVLICGRFEGIDERVLEEWSVEEVSLGDFVLMGGEVAALALTEAVVRLVPGVIGSQESLEEESFSQGLLEYPQYTRPRQWKGRQVPEVLLSGHHAAIKTWRHAQAEMLTRTRRSDLWERYKNIKSVT